MWVGLIAIPLERLAHIRFVVTFLLTTGALLTKKCPVALKSDMAYSPSRVIFFVSKMVFACGVCIKTFFCMIFFHAVALFSIGTGVL